MPTLYERLGGVFAIATVVDDFIDRVMDDARLNANPKVNDAHHKVPPAGFKYLVTEQVCHATGGPQRYTGRSMLDSHAHRSRRPHPHRNDGQAESDIHAPDETPHMASKKGRPAREPGYAVSER